MGSEYANNNINYFVCVWKIPNFKSNFDLDYESIIINKTYLLYREKNRNNLMINDRYKKKPEKIFKWFGKTKKKKNWKKWLNTKKCAKKNKHDYS